MRGHGSNDVFTRLNGKSWSIYYWAVTKIIPVDESVVLMCPSQGDREAVFSDNFIAAWGQNASRERERTRGKGD